MGHRQDKGRTQSMLQEASSYQAGAATEAVPGLTEHTCRNSSLLHEDTMERLLTMRWVSTSAERNSPS